MAVNSTDKFIVNRSNQSYQVEQQNLMANLRDDDLMLVNRGGQSYKATGLEIKESVDTTSPPVIGSVSLVEDSPGGDRFTSSDFTTTVAMTALGDPAATLGIKATLEAKLVDKLQTSAITNVSESTGVWAASTTTFNPMRHACYGNGYFVGCGNGAMFVTTDGINYTQKNYAGTWQSIAYGDKYNRYVAVGSGSSTNTILFCTGNPTGDWVVNNPFSVAQEIYGITYGAEQYWISGRNIMYRGEQGSTQYSGTTITGEWRDIAYGNGVLAMVAAKSSNNRFCVFNATTPQTQLLIPGEENEWRSIAYGNGLFVAVASTGTNRVAVSSDLGQTWTSVFVTPTQWWSIDFYDGMFVAVSKVQPGEPYAMQSVDGLNWTYNGPATNPGTNREYTGIAGGNGLWVAVPDDIGEPGMYSATGGADTKELTFADNKDLSVFQAGYSVEQSDGAASGSVSSTDSSAKTMNLLNTIGTWTVGQTVIGPQRLLTSDEITAVTENTATEATGKWYASALGHTATQTNIAKGDGRVLITATYTNGAAHLWSDTGDANSWTTTGPGSTRNAAAYGGNNLWVSVGYDYQASGTISYSTNNAESWTKAQTTPSGIGEWSDVAYGNAYFVAVPSSGSPAGTIGYSTDGNTWNSLVFQSQNMTKIAYGNGRFVASGGSYMATSTTGFSNWEEIGFEGGWNDICYDNNMWVAVGSNKIATSTDGLNWTLATDIPEGNWRGVAYGNGVWTAVNGTGNPSNNIWWICSFNGKDWFAVSYADGWTGYFGATGVTYFNGKFISTYNGNVTNQSVNGFGSDTTLTFSGDKNLGSGFTAGDAVVQNNELAKASVKSTDAGNKQMTVAGVDGTFEANAGKFLIGPPTPVAVQETLYANLDSNLNVIDLQSADPGYTGFTGIQPKVKFPAVLPDGQTPDTTLLQGTEIKTTIEADNLAFPAVTKDSNTLTPGSALNSFDLNDPAQVAEFQVVKESLETYEQERDTRRATLAQAMRDASISEDEIKSVGLD